MTYFALCINVLKKGEVSKMKTQSMKINSKPVMLALFMIFLVFFISCGKKGAEWTGAIEEADGITVVKNPEAPLYSETILSLDEELSIGEAEGREEYVFSRIRDVEVDKAGRIYALDSNEANVKVFDRDGNYIRTIGRKGQGPGELQSPNDIYIDDKDKIYISDVGNDRLSVFNEHGDFIDSFNFQEYSVSKIIGVNAKDEIVLLLSTTSKESGKGFLVFDYMVNVYSSRFELRENLYRFTIPVMQMFTKEGKMLSLSVPFQKTLCCKMDSRGNVYVAESQEYRIHIFSPDGKLIRRIEKEHERSKVSKQDVENYAREHFQEDENQRKFWLDAVRDQLKIPDYKPVFDRLYSDQEKLLVLRQELEEKKNTFVDVFDSGGKYIGIMLLSVLPRTWKDNKIYTIEEDEDGYQYVKRYKVNWKF